jgi:hypothetical protein
VEEQRNSRQLGEYISISSLAVSAGGVFLQVFEKGIGEVTIQSLVLVLVLVSRERERDGC